MRTYLSFCRPLATFNSVAAVVLWVKWQMCFQVAKYIIHDVDNIIKICTVDTLNMIPYTKKLYCCHTVDPHRPLIAQVKTFLKSQTAIVKVEKIQEI